MALFFVASLAMWQPRYPETLHLATLYAYLKKSSSLKPGILQHFMNHTFKENKCIRCNIREFESELQECLPDWDWDEYCDGDPQNQEHHFMEKLSGVKCLNCGRFIGNWE